MGSINANLNQEYVNWLQTQALPHSKGPMGITEAETILDSRPELDHAYQQRFLEQKMQQMETRFGIHGLPNSPADVGRAFQQARQKIASSSTESPFSEISKQAAQSGLGEALQLSTTPKSDVEEQFSLMANQLTEQKALKNTQAPEQLQECPLRYLGGCPYSQQVLLSPSGRVRERRYCLQLSRNWQVRKTSSSFITFWFELTFQISVNFFEAQRPQPTHMQKAKK